MGWGGGPDYHDTADCSKLASVEISSQGPQTTAQRTYCSILSFQTSLCTHCLFQWQVCCNIASAWLAKCCKPQTTTLLSSMISRVIIIGEADYYW